MTHRPFNSIPWGLGRCVHSASAYRSEVKMHGLHQLAGFNITVLLPFVTIITTLVVLSEPVWHQNVSIMVFVIIHTTGGIFAEQREQL